MVFVESITKYFGAHRAIDAVSFELRPGEIVGLLGLNGAGKSTTLGILAGTLWPSSGEVRFQDCTLGSEPEKFRARVGFLPETPPLYGEMTPEETLRFAGELRGLSSTAAKERAQELLGEYELASLRSVPVDELSRGQRQRVGIAQSLVHRPELLVLDEPASGLDPLQLRELRERLSAMRGVRPVLISSHHLAEARELCDRFIVLHRGQLVAQGTAEELHPTDAPRVTMLLEIIGPVPVFAQLAGVTVVELSKVGGRTRLRVEAPEVLRGNVLAAVAEGGATLVRMEDTAIALERIFETFERAP